MGYSKQREMLLSVLRATKKHPTANMIYEEMRKRDPKISLGTVYRNLAKLVEEGAVLRIDTEDDSVHYDGFTHPHYHFMCGSCGEVSDLSMKPMENINAEIENEIGADVVGHTLVFYGKCKKCK